MTEATQQQQKQQPNIEELHPTDPGWTQANQMMMVTMTMTENTHMYLKHAMYLNSFQDMPGTVLSDTEVCTHIQTHLILPETI